MDIEKLKFDSPNHSPLIRFREFVDLIRWGMIIVALAWLIAAVTSIVIFGGLKIVDHIAAWFGFGV